MKERVTKTKVLFWVLFPIELGDDVRIKGTKRKGIVCGMTVPCNLKGDREPHCSYFERVTYDVLEYSSANFPRVRTYKRWEIEKIVQR